MAKTWQQRDDTTWVIRGWFILTALAGAVCLYHLAVIGETSLHSVFLGYSLSRLVMMGAALAVCAAGITGTVDSSGKIASYLLQISKKNTWKTVLTVLFLIVSLAWILCGFLSDEKILPYYLRARPLLYLGMFLTGSGALLLFGLGSSSNAVGPEQTSIRRKAVVYFLVFCVVYLFIRLTGIGIVPDEMDWQPTGMGLQYWELWLSLWIALALSLLLRAAGAEKRPVLSTVILFILIWGAAAVLWISLPSMEVLDHSYFMEITAPDYLPFPASDSAYYGLWAESILAGFGFKSTIASRPFLIVSLAFFEKITGGNVLRMTDCITLTLALIPALMFLLGKRLHSYGAGILAASLAVLREYNTIRLAPCYMVSSSKMWLSDLPAMLCLLAVLCAAVDWFRKPFSFRHMLLTGCLAGFSVLVRSQLVLLIPVLALFFLFRKDPDHRKKLAPAAGFVLAAFLIMAPWLIRSKIISGDFILDDPGIHSTELARRWSDDIDNIVSRESGESDAEYAERNKRHMAEFFFQKPLYVLHFIASHFGANELCALTALPFGTDPELTVHDAAYTGFHDVEGRLLEAANVPGLLAFLVLIALGMSAAGKRSGVAGLLPFWVCTLYHLLTACGRYSGWRFALPADWFGYYYFALGCGELAFQIAAAMGETGKRLLTVSKTETEARSGSFLWSAGILVLFLCLGAAPALCGKIIPRQVFSRSTEENLKILEEITVNH
ncbi:MAG: hypothetical protein IKP86_06955, partial [Anaerolineaceae bacterium]|nr:hypothetical protein [Anaerolineaceae bacterium]